MTRRALPQRDLNALLDAMFVGGANWREDRGLARTTPARTLRQARKLRRHLFDGLVVTALPKAHRRRR